MFRGKIRSIHFIGIGGVGMSGIAEVLLDYGFEVTGSDLRINDYAARLIEKGAKVATGHAAANVATSDVVVFSSAVSPKNPEVVEAKRRGVPVIPRAEMLGELMRLKDGIAIAGSHGKTTTTSLVATVLRDAGLDPTVVIGGKLNALGSGAASGAGDLLVAEADESDGSFLHLTPGIAVITNIDPEHLDHYGTLAAVKDAFVGFANRVPFYGLVVACLDHPNVQDILPAIDKRIVTYGLAAQADYRALNPRFSGLAMTFSVVRRGEPLGEFEVRMPGIHNVLNALATIAVADELAVPHERVREALRTFGGVQRRFTIVGEHEGVTIVDDYGHHPAEVQVTLDAAQRAYGRRLVVAFQPHRYTRTRDCFLDLTRCFNRADVLLLTDVYAAGEEPIQGADSAALVEAIRAHGHRDVALVPDRADLVDALRARLRPGDVVLTLGAGDITKTGRELLAALEAR
ncbi:MAG: UDP-N-acetylmuramate--L-alanine ligase [Polyangiales bacterium]|nr:UDP-N-acetylmuramate--L-alanine ligase [Myxococcales bacterium]MCB9657008.1 UDP-N-acetylmuramate--L-alanine ligase [Sandaracinaceae bacterium]